MQLPQALPRLPQSGALSAMMCCLPGGWRRSICSVRSQVRVAKLSGQAQKPGWQRPLSVPISSSAQAQMHVASGKENFIEQLTMPTGLSSLPETGCYWHKDPIILLSCLIREPEAQVPRRGVSVLRFNLLQGRKDASGVPGKAQRRGERFVRVLGFAGRPLVPGSRGSCRAPCATWVPSDSPLHSHQNRMKVLG